MSNTPPHIDVLPDSPYPSGFDKPTLWMNRRRVLIFISTFALGCLVCLPYNFMRPAIYESTGTLLVLLPIRDTESDESVDIQQVIIHGQALTSQSMLTKVLGRLSDADDLRDNVPKTLSDFNSMLKVTQVESTNMIKLSAEGPQQKLLPFLVNTLIDVYLESHANSEKASFYTTSTALHQQLKELEQKVFEKRQELELFRTKYDIVSTERIENLALARFKGLTDTLTKANEEKVAADAHLKAINDIIAQGKPVVRAQEQHMITILETRAVERNEQLKEFEQKYTPEYMAIDNNIRALVRKLELLEEKIRLKREESQQAALAEAEQTQITAQRTVIDLEQQMAAYKKTAADFTKRFAEHEALQEELAQLEDIYNQVSERSVKTEVTNRQQLPGITVLERAFLPEKPVRPNYLRDAGISIAGSLLLGFLAVWFLEFFTRPTGQFGDTQQRPFISHISSPQALPEISVSNVPAPPMLEHRMPHELSDSEMTALMEATSDLTRLIMNTILSGLSIEEVIALRWEHINLEAGEILVPGESVRTVPMSAQLKAAFVKYAPPRPVAGEQVWRDAENNSLTITGLSALISCAAYDSGLTNPAEINEHALRHTYLAFLFRQGARLGDIERIVGHLSPYSRDRYSILSPPGAGLPLDQIETVYPTLQNTSPN